MHAYAIFKALFGQLLLEEKNGALTRLGFSKEKPSPEAENRETELLQRASEQLAEYFAGKRKAFSLPLAPEGTEFQKTVWRALEAIPYGETCSYKDIANGIGNPNGCRAVGLANGKNPIAIIIPCHRVIGTNGKLTGFGGGLDVKQYLLTLEKKA